MRTFNTLSKSLIVLFMVGILIVSCKQQAEESVAVMEETVEKSRAYDISSNEEAHIDMAVNYINAIMANDTALARTFVADSYWDFGPGAKDSVALDDFLAGVIARSANRTDQDAGVFINNALVVNEGPLAGEWVSVWGNYSAKEGDYSYDVPWHRVFRFEEGKIVLSRVWYDRLSPSLDMGAVQVVEGE